MSHDPLFAAVTVQSTLSIPIDVQRVIVGYAAYSERDTLAAVGRDWARAVGLALLLRNAADVHRWWGHTPELNPLRALPIRRLRVDVAVYTLS